MTEQQPFQLLSSDGDFELRRYPAHVVAETTVDSAFDEAGNRAFRSLFGYISGENVRQESISMTSPVVQSATPTSSSQRIAMTAPVIQEFRGDQFVVAFVLPATFTEHTAPMPTRAGVRLRSIPARLSAVLRFTGRSTQSSYEGHRTTLLASVAFAGLTTIGEARLARFDPPYRPWFLRHNEVAIDVEMPSS